MTIELSEKEGKILREIARDYKTRYQLHQLLKVAADSTVHKALKKLMKLELIEVKREEPFSRIPGMNKKYFGVTFRGLIAALKNDSVKLQQIQQREELVTDWVRKVQKFDNENKISQVFHIESFSKDKRLQILQNLLIEEMKDCPPELEQFLKHYDLDYSTDAMIFGEWVWHIVLRKGAGLVKLAGVGL